MPSPEELFEHKPIWQQEMQEEQVNLSEALLDFLPEDCQTVLDVGCGDGKITQSIISNSNKEVVGLDASQEALSLCSFKTILGNAAHISTQSKSFDAVISTDMLEHLPDEVETRVWKELFRVAAKTVMVAVPFREVLLDGMACCDACQTPYHLNWHMRAYDWKELVARAPKGWEVSSVVLTGKAWMPYHLIETYFRRNILKEYNMGADSICPECGYKAVLSEHGPSALPKNIAALLGQLIYRDLNDRGEFRTHSEILVVYQRKTRVKAQHRLFSVAQVSPVKLNECKINIGRLKTNLLPYPRAAQAVASSDGGIVLQLPVYSALLNKVVLRWRSDISHPVLVSIEDGLGVLFCEEVVPHDNKSVVVLELERYISSGYYGLIVRLPMTDAIEFVSIGHSLFSQLVSPADKSSKSYYPYQFGKYTGFIQCKQPFILSEKALLGDNERPIFLRYLEESNILKPKADIEALPLEEVPSVSAEKMELLMSAQVKEKFHYFDQQDASKLDYLDALFKQSIPDERHPKCKRGSPLNFIAICHDQDIDRRILHQVDALLSAGKTGLIIALSKTREDQFDTLRLQSGKVYVHYVGLKRVTSSCPIYWQYQKRQATILGYRNDSLPAWLKYQLIIKPLGYKVCSYYNLKYYGLRLKMRYNCASIHYPLPFDLAFFNAANLYSAQLIFAHDLTALKAAVEVGAIWNTPVIYDSHELYSEQKVFSKTQKNIMDEEEIRYIKRCHRVMTVSDSFGRVMLEKNKLSKQPDTVLNVADRFDASGEEWSSLREKIAAKENEKIVLYQGGIIKNRNLMNLLLGFSRLARTDLHLVFLGPAEPHVLAQLKRAANASKVSDHIHFLEPVSQATLLNVTETADVGVIPYSPVDKNTQYCMPNKLFEYIQANLPILANQQLVEVSHIMSQLGGGGCSVKLTSARDFSDAIEMMLRRDLEVDRATLKKAAKTFNWDTEKHKFLKIVDEVMEHA
ncbi:MAG: methyltransferase domain-containing protein [Legionellaceae bacterium]|nr:methyltransferase domain-containing protein [Legionellaceae bacterium]